MPPLEWRAIIAGVALAGVISVIAAALLPPIPAALASFFGLFASGVLAGKLAPAGRLYHGAVVGAGYVCSARPSAWCRPDRAARIRCRTPLWSS